MKALLSLLLLLPAAGTASAWWVDADHTFGDGGLQKTSGTLFFKPGSRWVTGLNAGFYNDDDVYTEKIWTLRLPVMLNLSKGLITLKPFFYPERGPLDSSAWGAKAGLMLPVTDEGPDGYTHLSVSAAAARQKTLTAAGARAEPSSYALEVQIEKNYFDQFFFLAHAAGFLADGPSATGLPAPSLDHSDLSFFGAFAPVTAEPQWAAGMQFARNMAPDYDSHVYAGFSRISFKSAAQASSAVFGMRLKLWETSSVDLGYNLYKPDGAGSRNRYKILYQVFFQ
ncbi:MAG: hypothetical protein RQ748_02460 [Elusimicrobiales bacterium]|nr:hypothetical protein [Elusimicrobiales bacterium]